MTQERPTDAAGVEGTERKGTDLLLKNISVPFFVRPLFLEFQRVADPDCLRTKSAWQL